MTDPPTYYHATSLAPPPRPPLIGVRRADVCVVGAGFTGLSAGLNLAERGYDVVILEAQRVGWGASGRNGGQIGSGFPVDMKWLAGWAGPEETQQLFALSEEAKAIIRERVERHGIACELKWGGFQAAEKPRQAKALAATAAYWRDTLGYQGLSLIESAAETRSYVNSPHYVAGLHDAGSGQLHPLKYCRGLTVAAEAAGATIYEASPATELGEIGGEAVVETPKGRIVADALVLCGNAYLGDLVPAIRRVIAPLGSYIVATRPLGEALARDVIPADVAVFDSDHILTYYRLSADRRLLFGGRVAAWPLRPPDPRRALGAKMRRLFPQLDDVSLDHAWGGQLAFTATRMPHVGRLGSRTYFAQGYAGEGVAMSGLVGKVLAEAISGQLERFDLFARLPHRPFPGGRHLQGPALLLGMMWYKLCDLIS